MARCWVRKTANSSCVKPARGTCAKLPAASTKWTIPGSAEIRDARNGQANSFGLEKVYAGRNEFWGGAAQESPQRPLSLSHDRQRLNMVFIQTRDDHRSTARLSPAAALILDTLPFFSARRMFSIFIASMVHRVLAFLDFIRLPRRRSLPPETRPIGKASTWTCRAAALFGHSDGASFCLTGAAHMHFHILRPPRPQRETPARDLADLEQPVRVIDGHVLTSWVAGVHRPANPEAMLPFVKVTVSTLGVRLISTSTSCLAPPTFMPGRPCVRWLSILRPTHARSGEFRRRACIGLLVCAAMRRRSASARSTPSNPSGLLPLR